MSKPINRKPPPAQPDAVKAAGKAARRASARKQSLTFRDVLPLLLLLLLLGLGAAVYVLWPQLVKLVSPPPAVKRATATRATAEQRNAQDDFVDSEVVRRALKDEGVGLAATPLVGEGDIEKFKELTIPLIHTFLFTKYDLFASSKLTFRDMKQFISSKLSMPYEQLRTDEYSAVIEDAVDAVTKECRAGKTPRDECATKFGYTAKE